MSNDYYDTDWTLQDFETPAEKAAKLVIETEKGVCPKCRRRVGRGLHIHMKSCNGHSEQA